MRIGNNPEKQNNQLSIDHYHRVIIPVFIPNLTDDYFKDGLVILKLCLSSLLSTIHDKTKISLVNNGCCNEVAEYLNEVYQKNPGIDQLLVSDVNLGKVNALYSIIKSNLEPLFTVADADVMFLPNWQEHTEQLLKDFPSCGMASPVPSVGSLKGNYLKSSIGYAYLKGKIKKENVLNPKAIKNFLKSIGRPFDMPDTDLRYYTITSRDKKAVIGCGHFFATIRASVFENSPNYPSKFKIVGGSESKYIDSPNDKSGYLKLATLDNYGYHLGNTFEEWMQDELEKIQSIAHPKTTFNSQSFNNYKPRKFYFRLGYLIQKLIYR